MATINLQVSEIASMLNVDTSTAQRLLDVSSQLVRDYVNEADVPVSLLNEAVLRCSSWLHSSNASGIVSERAGALAVRYDTSTNNALEASGAASLLNQYKVSRMAVQA